MNPPRDPSQARPRVLIVGGGFAGLACARALRRARAEVVLVDRQNHHVFQPLLYQVATAALSPANIAAPVRGVLSRQRNCMVAMGEAERSDADACEAVINGRRVRYDYLVLAAGMRNGYFGHPEWEAHAPGLKSLNDALEIRRRILTRFEAAEFEDDDEARRAELTFVVIGGGPTGVEMAGAIQEIAALSIPRDFRRVDMRSARVVLIDSNERVLRGFHEDLSARAQRDLERMGVEVILGCRVVGLSDREVVLRRKADGECQTIASRCAIWAAGLKAESIGASLGAEADRAGRVIVEPDLSVPGHPNVFVVGDQMSDRDPETGEATPGVAQGAIQSGDFVGRLIAAELKGKAQSDRGAFRYHDKGSMATIGRARAVAEIGGMRVAGFPAWLLWSVVHILFLVGFRNKLAAISEWVWMYVSWSRGARLITGTPPRPPPPSEAEADRVY